MRCWRGCWRRSGRQVDDCLLVSYAPRWPASKRGLLIWRMRRPRRWHNSQGRESDVAHSSPLRWSRPNTLKRQSTLRRRQSQQPLHHAAQNRRAKPLKTPQKPRNQRVVAHILHRRYLAGSLVRNADERSAPTGLTRQRSQSQWRRFTHAMRLSNKCIRQGNNALARRKRWHSALMRARTSPRRWASDLEPLRRLSACSLLRSRVPALWQLCCL